MFNTVSHRAKLIAHKEGKLKSYESCLDVRAWSHDDDRRSSCLRDWIRGDIPVCVLPVLALTRHLNNMTRKRRTTLVPPCSPECRSKIILDNIYESCHAIEECLRNEEEFQNVFENDEFETSHWPCERCVEILKSIKLFWNIVLEKLLKITFPINEDFDDKKTKSIPELARHWKDEIVDQTLKVRNLQSLSKNRMGIHKDSQRINQVINNQELS
ncbi:uncharacterized protein LOC121733700 isoform X2 [Aricia agestis]|uniref:uncharacterized protein LOC121733700 isoform X2 n=1 Tax=Aricia agestis TaxID=91739 RepID=UPI001C205C65|nr:uncharacterized protein LOC121733700 isoform X2 [Aricia agestis]